MEDCLIIGYDENEETDHICLTTIRRVNGITYVLNQLYDEEAREIYNKLIKKDDKTLLEVTMISEEEKKAIEYDLKCLHNVMNNFEDELCEIMQEKVEIVKQFIEKQNKKIKHLKNLNKQQSKEISKAVDYTFELDKELEAKDKIINEMAEHIVSSAIVDDTVCAIKCDCETDILEDCTHEKMLNCTKEYFGKKVEENG